MRLIFFLFALCLSIEAFAHDKILLITSFVETNRRVLSVNPRRKDLHYGVEAIFRKKLQAPKDQLEVIQDADASKLFQKVRSGNYKAIFWVSHSNKGESLGTGIGSRSVILDKNDVDVKDIFFHLHPGTTFLALVGCYSESFASELSRLSTSKIIGFNKKVDILKGLKKSIKTFHQQSAASDFPQSDMPVTPLMSLRIERVASKDPLPPLFVYQQGKLLTVLPASLPFSSESFEITFDKIDDLEKLKFVISTGKFNPIAPATDDFGELHLSLPEQEVSGEFTLLTVGGRPLGTRTRIFHYRGITSRNSFNP